ncbi:DMT family transporter [Mycobacterium sp.]|uniref:DMT family transporter n=1 Tax=Mycobacterium sp. TaxID=1785 RepID=UPI003C70AFBC
MAKADIAALLALGAAFFIAIGDVIHQRSAHEVADESVGHVQLFLRLLRDRQWWLGSVVAAVGFSLQAAALGLGSVLLVQALLVTSLLFALPMSAKAAHRRVTRWEWIWAVALAGSVAVIVTVGNPQAGQSRASLETWTAVVAVMGPVLVLCVLGARMWAGSVSAVLLAFVSGALWGVFAVLTKGVVDRLDDGLWPLLRTPELYAWALLAIAGTAFQQSSFRAGTMTASLPTMTVAEPVVASVLGIVVLGETLNTDDAGWLVLGLAIVAMVVATIALARGEALASDEPVDAETAAAPSSAPGSSIQPIHNPHAEIAEESAREDRRLP